MANRCYQSNIYTFSGFLVPAEQALLYEMEQELSFVPWTLFGGGESCERAMVRFGNEAMLGYDEPFPIVCLVVKPLHPKFAEALTHRDFLGALMHLGIARDVLGDIVVREHVGYVFCETGMAAFLKENLGKVRHTSVLCEIAQQCPAEVAPELVPEELVVSSSRADAIVAKAYRLSRSESVLLFRAKRIFVNGRQYENNSGVLKAGDIVSVRGYGKFVFDGTFHETKKGRIRVKIQRYAQAGDGR